jgi:archaellum biogenesis ATPase FlaH
MAKIDLDLFERVVIQNCLKKDSVYLASIIDYLDKSLFKNEHIGKIAELLHNFYLERNIVPSLIEINIRASNNDLKENLREVVKLVRELGDVEYNDEELVNNTEYFIKQRKVGLLTEKIVDEKVKSKEFNLDDIQKEWEKIHAITLVDNFGLDYFEENDYLQQKDSLISTGYLSLDEAFGGGFQKEGKAIYDIGGETNIGKSIFLANIAVNIILQNLNVVIISPEMSEMRYAKRISGMLTGIAIKILGDQIDQYKREIENYKRKITSKLIIKEVPTKGVSAKNVSAYLKKLKDKKGFKPDLICIDGHALLRPSVSQPSKHTELQFIVQECRALSYTHEAPILTVAQLNRSSHKANNPGLDNMAGSWDQLADFDSHVNIWQTDEDREASLIRFSGKKVRDGSKGGEGFLNIDYDTLRLTEELDPTANIPFPADSQQLSSILDVDSFIKMS